MGILLLNLGGPDSLQAVRPFLYNLFSDRQIIRLGPSFLQKPLAWLISTLRSKKTEGFYRLIGGKSPILDITIAQARALEEALNKNAECRTQNTDKSPHPPFTKGGQEGIKVFVGMRYWHPLIKDTVKLMHKAGIKRIVALSLYPHYSVATTGSSILKVKEVVSGYRADVSYVESWFNHPLYIEALVDVMKKGIESFTQPSAISPQANPSEAGSHQLSVNDVHILFSAHSLPQKFIDAGDPYVNEIMGTIGEVTKKIDINWHLSYQSKSGPVKWLEPSTDEKLKELAAEGVRNILVVPISFVSDHIETLYEIDILYKRMAEGLGINLKRTESLNTHPLFIGTLKDIVINNMKESGWLR
ncbi:MAG: ferrochelatase [Nitrospirae bacterium]|nr:MAG: ferrochelatase [Nitrospirota bacterium]